MQMEGIRAEQATRGAAGVWLAVERLALRPETAWAV
jgi:hypothetical protein